MVNGGWSSNSHKSVFRGVAFEGTPTDITLLIFIQIDDFGG